MEYKEDIESGSKAAVKGGFTAVVSMPNTSPTADNPDVVAYMAKRSNEVGICKVLPTGALSMSLAGHEMTDFAALKEAGAVAITDDGTIDAIATDHAPHSPTEKEQPIETAPFGIIGLETAFPLIYTHFVKTGKLPLSRCIDLMSKQAGALFKIECGRITVDAIADLCLLDLNTAFVVDESFFASKSKNSPFIGQTLYGQNRWTMTNGRVVFNNL